VVPRLEASPDYNAICVGLRPRSPPLPLFNFIKHKRGGTVPPRKNCGGTIPPLHKGVPPFHKPPVFTRRDGPASAQTRPAFPQTTSFYEAGRSRLVSPVHKQSVKTVVVRSRLSPPVFKHLVKIVVGRPRLSPPVHNNLLKTMVGRSRLSPPVHKHLVKTVVGPSRLSPPVHKHFLKTVAGRSRLSTNASHLFINRQFLVPHLFCNLTAHVERLSCRDCFTS